MLGGRASGVRRIARINLQPFICISGGAETPAIDKWAMLIYEMHNLENEQFETRVSQAMAGELDADTLASKCLEDEFIALQKIQEFQIQNPLTANGQVQANKYYQWMLGMTGTFEDFKKRFEVPQATSLNSNLKYFKEYYETSIAPYRNLNSGQDE